MGIFFLVCIPKYLCMSNFPGSSYSTNTHKDEQISSRERMCKKKPIVTCDTLRSIKHLQFIQ